METTRNHLTMNSTKTKEYWEVRKKGGNPKLHGKY